VRRWLRLPSCRDGGRSPRRRQIML
jgi:hypothetical protein